MGTARGDIDEGRLMESALDILTVGRGDGLLEGVILRVIGGQMGGKRGKCLVVWGILRIFAG